MSDKPTTCKWYYWQLSEMRKQLSKPYMKFMAPSFRGCFLGMYLGDAISIWEYEYAINETCYIEAKK